MTPQALYQKVLNEEMSQAQFLFQIRRDEGLSSFITNTNTYNQTITQLKNRGHIFDIKEAEEESFDLLGSIKMLTEATKPKLDRDHANDYEFQQGWRYELDLMKEPDIEKARTVALKNIQSDPIFYTRLLLLKTKKPSKRTDQPVPVNTGKTNMVDKDNGFKPVKSIEKDKNTPKGSAERATKPKGVKTIKGVASADLKTVSEGYSDLEDRVPTTRTDKKSISFSDLKSGQKVLVGYSDSKNPTAAKVKSIQGDKIIVKDTYGYTHEFDKNLKCINTTDKRTDKDDFMILTSMNESIFSPSDDKPVKGKEVSFTVEDHTDPNKKLQIKKTVKSGKKTKDGTFELSFTEGDKITMSKTNKGVSSLYFENPSDAKSHDKVVDLDKGLATLADKLFPKEQEKAVNEDHDNNVKKWENIEEKYGDAEILKLLSQCNKISFDYTGQAIDAILNDKDFLKSDNVKDCLKQGDLTKDILKNILAWKGKQTKDVSEGAVDESISIKPRVYPFSLEKLKSLKQRGDEILHFNQGTYGRITFLVDADVKNHYSAAKASSRDGKVAAHSLKTVAKAFRQSQEMIIDLRGIDVDKLAGEIDNQSKSSEALRESLKKIIRKKLNEQEITGPTAKKNELNDLMKRYDWYFDTSDNASLKQRGQETHEKAMLLVTALGDDGVEVFNSYAPEDKKIKAGDVNEEVKHYAKMSEFDSKEKGLIKAHIDTTETLDNCILVYKREGKRLIIRDYPEVDKAVTVGKGLIEKEDGKAYVITSFGTADVINQEDVQKIKDNAKHAADFSESKKLNESRATKKITILADDSEGTIENILKALQGRGNGGHSFSITVDEDGEDGGDKFGWDGDGSDYIEDIKVETLPKEEKK